MSDESATETGHGLHPVTPWWAVVLSLLLVLAIVAFEVAQYVP